MHLLWPQLQPSVAPFQQLPQVPALFALPREIQEPTWHMKMSNKKYADVYFEREFPFFVVCMIGIKLDQERRLFVPNLDPYICL
jgi:hypothetical protein